MFWMDFYEFLFEFIFLVHYMLAASLNRLGMLADLVFW